MATSTKSKKRSRGLPTRVAEAVRSHVADQSEDAWGIGLILFAVLTGLGMYAAAAGPVGEFLEAILRGVLGVFGYLVPIVLAYVGLLIVVDRPSPEIGRIAVGLSLITVAVVGGWHVIAGLPVPADGMRVLWPAGGLLGWAVSRPLVSALSVWGAGAVLGAGLVLGLLIVTATPFSAVVATLREWTLKGRAAVRDDSPGRAGRPGGPSPDGSRDTADADDAGDDGDGEPQPRIRSTVAGKTGDQPELEDGLTEADRLAGRTPAPPRPELTEDGQRKARAVTPVDSWEDYELPPMELLGSGRSLRGEAKQHIRAQVEALQDTLDEFGIDASVTRWSRGPTVTRFEIELGPGVKVKKVANLERDIAYSLAAADVRIVAPIPGKSAIGVEVPNSHRDLITVGDILRSDEAQSDDHPLFVALGVDIAGNPALVNLAEMPHLLVSGATGSGKSVTLNSMITSVIMRSKPSEVRMILIDPKRVELTHYEGVPHLLTKVVTDPKRATDAVEWTVKEMEKRYDTLARLGYRDLDSYNEAVESGEVARIAEEQAVDPDPDTAVGEAYQKMPYILMVIDELADLMLVAPRDVEDAVCRLAQMARAVGIHMVIATQRPSVDVITGLIKANVPSRLSLAVASNTDSRTILDQAGAEKLVGNGDMLYLPASQGKPSRLQGCFISEREIGPVVDWCRRQREADYVDGVVKTGEEASEADLERGDHDSDEAMIVHAAERVVDSQMGSVSMLQRKLRIGFARAGRLMDELEELGCVGPNEGSKAREVHWGQEDLEQAKAAGVFDDVFEDVPGE